MECKLQHWRGSPGIFGLEAAPVLEFGHLPAPEGSALGTLLTPRCQ